MMTSTAVSARLFDHDWNMIGTVDQGWRLDEPGVFTLPLDHPLAQIVVDVDERKTLHFCVDYAGERWTGTLAQFEVMKQDFSGKYVKATFATVHPGVTVIYPPAAGI